MRKYILKSLFFLLASASTSLIAQNEERIFQEFGFQSNVSEITTNDGQYKIEFYNENIVETSFIPNGETTSEISHAVVLKPSKLRVHLDETEATISLSTNGITVSIQKQPFQISYSYKGKFLIAENKGFQKNDSLEVLNFKIDSKEALYGGGARALGMNRRGNRLELYNKAHYGYETHSELMNFTMPIVLSSKQYMLHFDNPAIGFLDLDSGHNNSLNYETIGGRKTYQVIADDSWGELLNDYTNLTGKQPLPPRWVFGNFASRFGYHSEKEARATVQKFEDDEIPLDAIIFDLYWFGKGMKGTMGNLEFVKDSFPTPKKMIADFKKKGIKTILITEPFVLNTSSKWKEVVEKDILGKTKEGSPYVYDFYFGTTGLIDIFKTEGKEWFWDIYKKYNNYGVSGWWGDLGEPEVHPSDLQHATGTADELHNIYGHNWAKLISEGYKKDFPKQRPFILMRAGYSGSQRFGLIPWSGDVNRSWGGLQSQMEISLQMGMQGIGYMHSDLGGFAGDLDDPELYTRWLQYGVFQPVFRPHAQEDVASEPVFKDAKTKALAKKAIELRYKLLPYNYTLAFENNQEGTPLIRALLFEEPENEMLFSESKNYLWGNEFLIHPIVNPGVVSEKVYFPKNTIWFDFYTDKKYLGGNSQDVIVSKKYIPTFVRAGAFIPMINVIQSTEAYSLSEFDLHFYYDISILKSEGQLYNDDGSTPKAFEKGKYELLSFTSSVTEKKIVCEVATETGAEFISEEKEINYKIHGVLSKPKKVKVGMRKVPYNWDSKTNILSVKTLLKANKKNKLLILL